MPRTAATAKLLPWKDSILQWLAEGNSHKEVRKKLADQTGLAIPDSTFKKVLKTWGIRVYLRDERNTDFDEIRRRVTYIFHFHRLTDEQTAELLQSEGHVIGPRRVKRLRREMGLFKRLIPGNAGGDEAAVSTDLPIFE